MIGSHEPLAVEPGARASAAVEREAAARAGADLNPFAQWLAVAAGKPGRADHVDHVFLGEVGNKDAVDLAARIEDRLLRHRRDLRGMLLWCLRILRAIEFDDLAFDRFVGI